MKNTDTGNSKSPKGLLERLLGPGKEPRPSEPLIIPRAEHTVSRKNMDEEVLKVLYRLHNSGCKAYLVGGAVRDLLLDRKPKDYDVATDARPDEIKKLFVNSRLIGRRFRLAHIMFKGRKVIEVSTFRRTPELPNGGDTPEGGVDTSDLLIREDNTWGTPQHDAYRRDLTVNALFYNIADFSIIDYVGGLADLNARLIRTIGDPNIRFREDPVRMIRAVEYSARLGFGMDAGMVKSIRKHRKDLRRASDARIADELLNLMRSGAAEPAFRKLWELGLLEVLHLNLHRALKGVLGEQFFKELATVDDWRRSEEAVRDVLLFSIMFNAPLRQAVAVAEHRKGGRLVKGEFLREVEAVLEEGHTLYRVPNRRQHQVKQAVLAAQKMRRRPSKQRGLKDIANRAYFLDAFELLRLEAETTGRYGSVLSEWMELKEEARRKSRIGERREQRPDRGRKRREEKGRGSEERQRREGGRRRDGRRDRPASSKGTDRPRGGRDQPSARSKPPREQLPEKEQEPAIQQQPRAEEIEHGRGKRENRSWDGVAGQQSSVVMDMKKKMESGEISLPSEEEIPYMVPGRSVEETIRDFAEDEEKADQHAPDDNKSDSDRWGRFRRSSG